MKTLNLIMLLLIISGSIAIAQQSSPNGYYVAGNKVFNASTGEEIIFKGVNRPSLEWNSKGQKLVQKDIQAIASSCANIVRIPLNQDFWLKNTSNYQSTVDSVVKWCVNANLHVILDLHWSQKNSPDTTAAQQVMADQISLKFWKQVATKYKSNGKVLFELYNEPHGITWSEVVNGGTYNNGTTSNTSDDWKMVGYQELYDTVRATGAKNLIIIGGNNWTFDLTYYKTNPIVGYNIMYATHCYPFSNKLSNNWKQWSYLAKSYPIIATEFGPKAYTDTKYIQEIVDTLTKIGGHFTAWAWWGFSNKENSMWNSFDPTTSNYDTTFYGKWFFKVLKQECNKNPTNISIDDTSTGFLLYPNPASNLLTISLPKTKHVNLAIYNTLGVMVMNKQFYMENETFDVDVSSLEKGVYFLKLNEHGKKIEIK